MFPFIQCQCFGKRRGVYLVEKVSVFIKLRVLFWPEISALGVSFNFNNEGMRPPKYPSPPPPPPPPPPRTNLLTMHTRSHTKFILYKKYGKRLHKGVAATVKSSLLSNQTRSNKSDASCVLREILTQPSFCCLRSHIHTVNASPSILKNVYVSFFTD